MPTDLYAEYFFADSEKIKFFRNFSRYCWVEHMWENRLYLNFVWALKNFHLFKQKTSSLCQKYMWNFLLQNQKKKNDQVMGNSELQGIHFKVFSYHNMPEVEWFQQLIYRIFCKSIISIGFHTNRVKYSEIWVNQSLHSLVSRQNS